MPQTKNFSLRVEVLDRILGGLKRYRFEELLVKLNESLELAGLTPIGRRTLYYDLEFLRMEKNAPLHTPSEGDQRYYYTRRFSLQDIPLSEEEVDYLRQAVEILKKAMPHMLGTEMEQLVSKLENRILTNTPDKENIIQFESHTEAMGSHWIERIFGAIRGKAALRVVYKPYHLPESDEKVFFPYLLKEYRSRWFVLGRYKDEGRIVNLALDRIKSIRNSSAEFEQNDLFDPDDYFRHIVGVSLPYDSEVQEVQIKVSASLVPYIRSKPIHRLQEIVREYVDGSIKVSMPLYINYELKSTLLGFGREVEVLKPESLRLEMAEILKKTQDNYSRRR